MQSIKTSRNHSRRSSPYITCIAVIVSDNVRLAAVARVDKVIFAECMQLVDHGQSRELRPAQ